MLDFLDRERELSRLERMFEDRSPGLAILYGRRRCGKSRILTECLAGRSAVYYMADERVDVLQRRALAREMSRVVPGIDRVEYPGWDELLERWDEAAPTGSILAIDEFPALLSFSPELPSLMQKRLERRKPRSTHTVLCGSSQRMMQGMVLDAAAPLYGRAREILRIEPLPAGCIRDALRLEDPVKAVEAYSVWGGIPRYWELAAAHRRLPEAIQDLVLDPLGVLHREPERILRDDIRELAQATSLLALIGAGVNRLSELGARMARPVTSLTRPLARLVELGFVTRETPAGEDGRSSRRSRYVLGDPFLRFWFRFVEPNLSRLQVEPVRSIWKEIEQALPGHIGSVWEDLARACVPKLEIAGENWSAALRWWGKDHAGREVEIDVVANSSRGKKVLVGEVKRRCAPREVPRLLADLRSRAGSVPGLAGKELVTRLWVLDPVGGSKNAEVIGPAEVLTV